MNYTKFYPNGMFEMMEIVKKDPNTVTDLEYNLLRSFLLENTLKIFYPWYLLNNDQYIPEFGGDIGGIEDLDEEDQPLSYKEFINILKNLPNSDLINEFDPNQNWYATLLQPILIPGEISQMLFIMK